MDLTPRPAWGINPLPGTISCGHFGQSKKKVAKTTTSDALKPRTIVLHCNLAGLRITCKAGEAHPGPVSEGFPGGLAEGKTHLNVDGPDRLKQESYRGPMLPLSASPSRFLATTM